MNEIYLPTYLGCKLCRYYFTDVCEPCLKDGQFPWFEVRKNLNFDDLPFFSGSEFNNGMPVKMRQIVMGVYTEVLYRTLKEMRG